MGFFSDLKEDLSQAVNELMPEEELKKEETSEGAEAEAVKEVAQETVVETTEKTDEVTAEELAALDAMLENLDDIQVPEDMDITKMEEQPVEDAPEETDFLDEELAQDEEYDLEASIRAAFGEKEEPEEVLPEINEISKGETKMETQMKTVSDETAIITAGMCITGDILSEGSMEVIGCINGNVEILGKLNITGTICGNSKAAEIFADSAKVTGEIVSEGAVKIGQSSVIIGNISAKSAVIAGAVKGDIDVMGPVILDTSAIVMGNIKSKSVQINNGAVIEGMCSQCYAEVNPTSFFDGLKKDKK
ncbi:MAG: polymer-forming cytoskeletal protein [Lachnospiraceae bacterium]|nr:polymer-forming cytoskeletal protein [Lachnospiraceae bacterium]